MAVLLCNSGGFFAAINENFPKNLTVVNVRQLLLCELVGSQFVNSTFSVQSAVYIIDVIVIWHMCCHVSTFIAIFVKYFPRLQYFFPFNVLQFSFLYPVLLFVIPLNVLQELIKGTKYDRKSDIWALGCLVYELCAMSPPFIGSNIKQLGTSIKEGRCGYHHSLSKYTFGQML